MWFTYLSTLRRSGSRQARPSRKNTCRLLLEPLEDRSLPSFLAPVSYPVDQSPNGPAAVAVGDFNHDGHPDLVVVNSGDDTISLFLGRRHHSDTAIADVIGDN